MKTRTKIASVVLAPVIGLGLYQAGQLSEYIFPKTEAAEKVKYTKEIISNEDFKKVEEIAFKSGYKRKYNFTYTPPLEEQEFVFEKHLEDRKNENLWDVIAEKFMEVSNSTDKFFTEKTISFDVKSITMFGYDTSNMKREDVIYDEETKTLYVKSPQLQAVIMTEYSNVESIVGGFKKLFDDFEVEELEVFYEGAFEQIRDKYVVPEEIEKGYELTNKSIKEDLLNAKFSFEIDEVIFDYDVTDEVYVVNDELTENTDLDGGEK